MTIVYTNKEGTRWWIGSANNAARAFAVKRVNARKTVVKEVVKPL